MYNEISKFIRNLYPENDVIPLHEPDLEGKEAEYLLNCIKSGYVSYVGEYVVQFEEKLKKYFDIPYAVAMNSGTSALHIALICLAVKDNDEVITQSLSFVATANAISYSGARPCFIDVDEDNLSLSPQKLEVFLKTQTLQKEGFTYNKTTGRRLAACIPMHTFGLAAQIDKIIDICSKYNIPVIEDAAESVGTIYKNKKLGTYAKCSALSFNGNKIVTAGCGGALLTTDSEIAKRAKHLSTTAKVPNTYEFMHDEVGYNYRMSNLNAAVACAQIEKLDKYLEYKRALASKYEKFFSEKNIDYIKENKETKSNYWINAIRVENLKEREELLQSLHKDKIMARPIWKPLHTLPMFKNDFKDDLTVTTKLYETIVNLPSSTKGLKLW